MFSILSKNMVVPLLLRLCLAAIFIFHGLALVGGEGHEWGANWQPQDAPNRLPAIGQVAVAWGQLLGGVALAFGFLTRLAALGIVAIMIGAIATVHWEHGFSIQHGGYEYNFAIIVMCVCLILGGSGPLAVDRVFHLRRRPPGQ